MGTVVSRMYQINSGSSDQNQARPVHHCETVSETVRAHGSSVQCDTFSPLQCWLSTRGFPQGVAHIAQSSLCTFLGHVEEALDGDKLTC